MKSPEQLFYYLKLVRSKPMGSKARLLLSEFKDPELVIANAEKIFSSSGQQIDWLTDEEIKKEIGKTLELGAEFLIYGQEDYPKMLYEIPHPPTMLVVRGNKQILEKAIIAIVGARNASINGAKMAASLANKLGENGIVVASGLARGIDTAAHKASLKHGTIAVMASGINMIYPEENSKLYHEILENDGLIVTEAPFNTPPMHKLFPRRNRIISGISYGTVVVEASIKSGSLITARFALEQGRSVFAVPGSPLDGRASGPNFLIKQGASLVERAEDILQEIVPVIAMRGKKVEKVEQKETMKVEEDPKVIPNFSVEELAAGYSMITKLLSSAPISLDEIADYTNLSMNSVRIALMQLEMQDKIARTSDGRVYTI